MNQAKSAGSYGCGRMSALSDAAFLALMYPSIAINHEQEYEIIVERNGIGITFNTLIRFRASSP